MNSTRLAEKLLTAYDIHIRKGEGAVGIRNVFAEIIESDRIAAENRQNTKPCRVDGKIPCVQSPEEDCGCDPCEECEVAITHKEKNETDNM